MARKRKNEMKTSVKSSLKYIPVRKSSRQIAKKQLEEKINGDVLQTSSSNNFKEFQVAAEEQTQPSLKKGQNSQRKHSKHKASINDNALCNTDLQYKRDAGESDSQDGLDNIVDQSEKLSPEDVRQMVVGNPNPPNDSSTEPASTEVEVWPEDVIEETIICEEMEVEDDAIGGYTLGSTETVVEQVLLVDEPNLEGKNFVEFTVIESTDGMETMVMATDTEDTTNNRYHIIQEGVDNLRVSEPENSISALYTDESSASNTVNSNERLHKYDKVYVNKKKTVIDEQNCKYSKNEKIESGARVKDTTKQHGFSKDNTNSLKEESSLSSDFLEDTDTCVGQSRKDQEANDASESVTKLVKNDSFGKIDDKLAVMHISESSKEIQKLVNDLSNAESMDSPVHSSTRVEKILPIEDDDESNSSILDKMEQLHQQNKSTTEEDNNILRTEVRDSPNPKSDDEKRESPDQLLSKPAIMEGKKSESQQKNPDPLQNIEELYRSTEMDCKIDGEDTKSSSSSENSNDTLLSMSNCKLRENDAKSTNSFSNDGEKKVEFRSRSGSTDTTGSESGSNSSGVRRSSRIRSIGLMKQRSRGRGLVTKSNVDITKANVQQERDRLINNVTPNAQEAKASSDNQPENQSDKESSDAKTSTQFDTLMPLSVTYNATGYDSDSSKPVKVKSRWRRSSELEMGGSSTGFGSLTGPAAGLGIVPTFTSEPNSRFTYKPGSVSTAESESSESGSTQNLTSTSTNGQVGNSTKSEHANDNSTALNNNSVASLMAQIPKTVGAKIPLPMVLEIKDREMEERLSQFEHLRENLYLTDRYTNKETKRMVCDCFLTEEDIERGELGCGEDCLNRLLMIECGPRCVVGDRCTNKRFQNCEYAKCEVFRTEKKGFGLRAIVDLMAGEFIMEYVGEVVDPKDFRRRAKEYSKDKNRHYYFMALKSDQIIDATMKGNVSRFINHSCDPNSETQKWTVNGELRIGFFNKKFIAAGEEITFDYHFQRYGKEAQKCFCEAPNCRGWIGDTPEEEKEKIEKKEKREKDVRKKKEEKKPADYMEDEDLEEEIDKLCAGGLKNRAHTLTLSRLMVRSRELEHRTRLLRLIQSGEQPCRRLFLDYHGLRLIWSYVMDIAVDDSEEAQQFRLEVLKTLNTLPIPNKTMLMDSKIYSVVEKWAKRLYLSPNGDSPEDDQVKFKGTSDDQSGYDNGDKKNIERSNDAADKLEKSSVACVALNEVKSEGGDQSVISELASSLLAEWANLKEVFRIPKKERIEQMKEHEREADRGYREELEKEEKRSTSYDRHRSDRYGRTETDKRGDRRRGRDSPESEHVRTKDKRTDDRSALVPIPRMTKYERRQLFALKVAKEEEERQRRQQQESWQDHEARCLALGIDPHSTAMMDPQTGYPVFYNPALGQWQHYPTQERGEIAQQCTPVYVGTQPLPGHSQAGIAAQSPHIMPPLSSDISPGLASSIPSGAPAPPVYPLNQTPVFNQTAAPYSLLPRHQQYPPDGQLPLANTLVPVHAGTPPVTVQAQPVYIEKPGDQQFPTADPVTCRQSQPSQPEAPPIDLPPKWKSAVDARGRTYYYHVRDRVSQWLPPPPDHIAVQPDSSSSSESSDETSSSNDDEDEPDDEQPEDLKSEEPGADGSGGSGATAEGALGTLGASRQAATKKPSPYNAPGAAVTFPEAKKRRDGLVQERIISPRREEDRMDHKTYKEIKEKLRRQKERAKLKEHVEKLRKHRRGNKSKSHSRHNLNKSQSPVDVTSMSERKIKDTFRINMANVMVHFLNPYRKNDCRQGRITNTEDFKHLARKLTHFVLAKELKHCKSVDELQCNENVKHKAKDFVRKYMSKFGAVYQKGTDED